MAVMLLPLADRGASTTVTLRLALLLFGLKSNWSAGHAGGVGDHLSGSTHHARDDLQLNVGPRGQRADGPDAGERARNSCPCWATR